MRNADFGDNRIGLYWRINIILYRFVFWRLIISIAIKAEIVVPCYRVGHTWRSDYNSEFLSLYSIQSIATRINMPVAGWDAQRSCAVNQNHLFPKKILLPDYRLKEGDG
jgi:hypothetical protein